MSYHSSFAKPPAGSDFREQDIPGVDYYRFAGDDWTESANSRRRVEYAKQSDFEIVDSAEVKYAFSEDDLRRAKSTAARLTALEKIAASGVDRFKFEDKDGVVREFRIETNKCGDKTLIHCYGKDSQGHEQIVMRAARNASGELEPERNKDGKPVSYYGDNWSRTMQGKSHLIGEDRNQHNKNESASSVEKHKQKESGDCQNDQSQRRRGSERLDESEGRRGPRFDVGRTLADVAMIAAPFLMAQLSNRNQCNEYYPYRDYPRHLPERGCRDYYDDYQHRQRERGCRNYYDNYNRYSRRNRGACR